MTATVYTPLGTPYVETAAIGGSLSLIIVTHFMTYEREGFEGYMVQVDGAVVATLRKSGSTRNIRLAKRLAIECADAIRTKAATAGGCTVEDARVIGHTYEGRFYNEEK